jgi:hypothetical protein
MVIPQSQAASHPKATAPTHQKDKQKFVEYKITNITPLVNEIRRKNGMVPLFPGQRVTQKKIVTNK